MKIFHQGISFVVIGGCLVTADSLVFVALTALGAGPMVANVAGRTMGMILGFWANGWVTFGDAGRPRVGRRRFMRYFLLWVSLTIVSTSLITVSAEQLGLQLAWVAKPVVEVALAVVSFLVSRHWVYR